MRSMTGEGVFSWAAALSLHAPSSVALRAPPSPAVREKVTHYFANCTMLCMRARTSSGVR